MVKEGRAEDGIVFCTVMVFRSGSTFETIWMLGEHTNIDTIHDTHFTHKQKTIISPIHTTSHSAHAHPLTSHTRRIFLLS